MSIPPASVGMPLSEVETPALLLDLDAYERNLDRMSRSLSGLPVRLRAHAKTHKSPMIACHQIERGAIGVCCQTVAEAEAMVLGGVRNVLLTNQTVTPGKIRRLVALARQAEIIACVDDEANIRDLAEAARMFGVVLPLLVEINIGQHRCGVEPGEPAVSLAQAIARHDSLRFAGIQAYHGLAQHVYEQRDRESMIQAAINLTKDTVDLLGSRGFLCEIVSGGGTGTYMIEAGSGVYNEIQSGSYIFMDRDYRRVEGAPQMFEHALFLLTSIVSAVGNRVVCDAGLKASSIDSGLPVVHNRPGVRYIGASDEHGTLDAPGLSMKPGEFLWLVPGHCDPTVNLHDWYVGIRNGRVEAVWPISAR